jgi:2-polyprenyl-3-methyl-5-hydroxy-6-metoxy-1,4-benzoquinol methylase
LTQSTTFDFRSKYTRTNPLTRFLLNGFFDAVEKLVRRANPRRVLEVGCGEGFSTQRLRAMLPQAELHACDVEERLVAAAQANNPQIPITLQSIYELHAQDQLCDLVLAMEVLEHLEDPARALKGLVSVANPWLIVSVPREPLWRVLNMARGKYLSDLGNTPGHIQHWSQRSFARFVSGFAEVVEVLPPLPWTVVLAKRR